MTGRKSQAETSETSGRLHSELAPDTVGQRSSEASGADSGFQCNPYRERISLNGKWDFMPLYDRPQELSLPPKILYDKQKVNVPSSWRGAYESRPGYTFGRIEAYDYGLFAPYDYPPEWDRAEAGLLRRSFAVPEEWAGRRIVLRLDGVMQQAAIYLNGIKLAIWRDGYLPLRLDATPYVRPGETCELQVVCANFDKTAIPSGAVKVTGLTGSWFGYLARGLWQDVWLESYPQTAIETVAVRTSVRESRLEIDASIGGVARRTPVGTLTASLKVRRIGGSSEAPVLEAETDVVLGEAGSETSAVKGVPTERNPQAASADSAAPIGGDDKDSGGRLSKLETSAEPASATESARSRDAPADEPRESERSAELYTPLGRETGFEPIAETSFANRSSGGAEESGTLLRLCENDALPPFGQANFRLRWTDAELWSPDSPVLYEAELELAEDGIVVDRRTERFGFREFWNEGPEFMLNGVPIRLRGDSWHFQGPTQQTEDYVRTWYAMCREVGVNCIRLHAEPYPEYFLKIADETGMLLVSETAIYGSGKSMAADHPDYILNSLEHVRRLVLRDRNRPSVVMWSVENEMRWVDGRDEFKRHIPALTDAMKKLDPTRLIVAEGDNRLLPRESAEVESRHYNIDGTIAQWDRQVPLTFGEHGSWWYICPQNASMYVGLGAYRHTDESARGLAEKERLFVEYARRQGVSGISTFNFAHYFMRAMPERDIPLEWNERDRETPGVKPDYIPAYSLTLNNGLLPPEYPAYRPNPAFATMAEAFRPAALIAAEYDRCFFDDGDIQRTFDVYNDTLTARDVAIEFAVSQDGRELRRETVRFRQQPAERRIAEFRWMPEAVKWTNGKADSGGESPTRAANEVREDVEAEQLRLARADENSSFRETGRKQSQKAQPEVEAANRFKNPNVDSAEAISAESASASIEETAVQSEGRSLETSENATLTAVLYHDGQPVHELTKLYRVFSADLRSEPVEVDGPCFYIGGDDDYGLLSVLVPDCSRTTAEDLDRLPAEALLIVGSFARDEHGRLERGAKAHAARGGRLLVLEQDVFSIGRLTLSRRDFIRAHSGSYDHPIFAGLGDDDLMFWDPGLREEGPTPIATAAFEKPAAGDYRLLLESSAGDFGDGGDLWTPLLEYRGGGGYLLANQLGLTSRFARVPQACLLLRRLLAHAGRADAVAPSGARSALEAPHGGAGRSAAQARFLGGRGGMAERLLSALRLPFEPLRRGSDLSALAARLSAASGPAEDARLSGAQNAPDDLSAAAGSAETAQQPAPRPDAGPAASGGSADLPGRSGPPSPGEAPGGSPGAQPAPALSDPRPVPGLLIVEPAMLREPGVPESARAFAAAGGAVLVLPCEEAHGDLLTRLLGRPTRIVAHEAYQLEADYRYPLAEGLSPADLFGLDKVHHSPRDVENLPLGLHRIEAEGARPICVSVEGTAWKDYFVHKHTAEHSRLALVELNRDRARKPGSFVVEIPLGEGRIVCSQIPLRPALDKNLRVYARLLGNLGAAFADDLWRSVKGDAHYAVEAMMALPCEPYQDEQAMRRYYTDPAFSLNNLGEGLYGWMKKKERGSQGGRMRIQDSAGGLWFLSAFVLPPDMPPVPVSEIGCGTEVGSGTEDSAAPAGSENAASAVPVRLRVESNALSVRLWLNGRPLQGPQPAGQLKSGINRLIVEARAGAEDLALAVFFEHPDGRPLEGLRYRMTIDEVEPK